MIQERYDQHEAFIDDYISSLQGLTDPGQEDTPDADEKGIPFFIEKKP